MWYLVARVLALHLLLPMWETQIEILAHGFGLAQLQSVASIEEGEPVDARNLKIKLARLLHLSLCTGRIVPIHTTP